MEVNDIRDVVAPIFLSNGWKRGELYDFVKVAYTDCGAVIKTIKCCHNGLAARRDSVTIVGPIYSDPDFLDKVEQLAKTD